MRITTEAPRRLCGSRAVFFLNFTTSEAGRKGMGWMQPASNAMLSRPWSLGLLSRDAAHPLHRLTWLLGKKIIPWILEVSSSPLVVCIYNGILLSHIHEWNWISCSDVDETGVYQTEWSKSEREKQISYINAYMWNLEKMTLMKLFAGKNRSTDVEKGLVDSLRGEERVGLTERVVLA